MIDYKATFTNTDGANFPNTKAVNASGPSATDGTEFIKAMIDDMWGFSQALLDYTDDTPNLTSEAAGASQRLNSILKIAGHIDTISATGTYTVEEWNKNGVLVADTATVTVTLAAGTGADQSNKVTIINQVGSTIFVDTGAFFDTLEPNEIVSYVYDGTSAFIRKTNNLPFNEIEGLEIANNSTDSLHDIDIAVGKMRDDADSMNMVLTSALTKQIDAAWAVGDNAGGLDTGTVAANSIYYIFIIHNPTNGNTDVLFSLSKTSPTMPTNYTKKRRIRGALLTDGSSDIIPFFQEDDYFYFDVMQQDYAASNYGTAAILTALSCPPDFIAILGAESSNSTGTLTYHLVTSPKQTDTVPSAAAYNFRNRDTSVYGSVILNVQVDSSSQVRVRSSSTAAGITMTLFTIGFIDRAK